MPLPFLLGGLFWGGVALHGSAAAINDKTQQIVSEAISLYDSSKESLKKAQKRMQDSLLTLGNTKKHVLDTSIAQFMTVYNRVKNAELDDANGLNELKNFMIDEQGILQLREMSNIVEYL